MGKSDLSQSLHERRVIFQVCACPVLLPLLGVHSFKQCFSMTSDWGFSAIDVGISTRVTAYDDSAFRWPNNVSRTLTHMVAYHWVNVAYPYAK